LPLLIPNIVAVLAHLFLFFDLFFPEDVYLYTIMLLVVYNCIYVLRHKKSRAMYLLSILLLLYGIWAGIISILTSAHGIPGTMGFMLFLFMLFCFPFGLFIMIFAQNTKEKERVGSEILDQDDPED
jgi:ABC-type transport system involved in multi-copper enzyme maturation permease subunit